MTFIDKSIYYMLAATIGIVLVEPLFAQQISSVPVNRVPPTLLRSPRPQTETDVTHLRQPEPAEHILDSGDTLAVFVEGVLGELDSNPPVQLPDRGSDLPPAIGFPVPVRETGSIDLPFIEPLAVKGLTVAQAENLIKAAYREGNQPILKPENRIMATLFRKRTYRVIVVRQDQPAGQASRNNSQGITRRTDQSSRGTVLQMPAYENDVLSALSRTGGLPGVNAKSDIRIGRASTHSRTFGDRSLELSYGNGEFPRSGSQQSGGSSAGNRSYSYRPSFYGGRTPSQSRSIPTRIRSGANARFYRADAELGDGDVLYVDSRQSEVYYTAGLLNGGEHLLPRDTDLDVFEAVASVGRTASGNANRQAPTELIVLRKGAGNGQVAIRVDLNRALGNPRERILVAPGDTLILRHKPSEKLLNIGNSLFNTYGARQLFR